MTSKGHQCLKFSKDLKQIYLLDDLGSYEFRTAYVCWACWQPWMSMDHHDFARLQPGDRPPVPTPLLASSLIVGVIRNVDTGSGKFSIRQCEDVRIPTPRLMEPGHAYASRRPGLPPPQFASAMRNWAARKRQPFRKK